MLPLTGRCYCGACRIAAKAAPQTACYCHCADCRRWTGAPAPAFAAFGQTEVSITPDPGPRSHAAGVRRWVCPDCGSPLMAAFDYLPHQVYVPVGVLDDPERAAPQMHTHSASEISWLHMDDGLPRVAGSGRAELGGASS